MRTLRKRFLLGLATLALLAVAGSAVALANGPGGNSKAPDQEWVQEVFIDYADDSHAGPGPDPTTESNKFRRTQGGIRCMTGPVVDYVISGITPAFATDAEIVASEDEIDSFMPTFSFAPSATPTSVNACTGGDNIVRWAAIDGNGGVLATTSVCRNTATKEIRGFEITIDIADFDAVGEFSALNVVTHEFGHVAGLGHVNAPKDGCLTMYRFAAPGETQKSTLGLGDKAGNGRPLQPW